jgi:hypothetical protein
MNIESTDSQAGILPLVAGILLITDGALKILFLLGSAAAGLLASLSSTGFGISHFNTSVFFIVCAIVLVFVGTFMISAGVLALKRKKWGITLAGSIIAAPLSLFAIAALVILIFSKKDFKT